MRRALPAAAATARLSDEAYNVIKRAIVACELEPGSEVTEAQLCERFGAGKASVRAALVMLAGDGLVRPVARRGYVIAPVTLKDAHDVFDVRSILEPAGALAYAGLKRYGAETPEGEKSRCHCIRCEREFRPPALRGRACRGW